MGPVDGRRGTVPHVPKKGIIVMEHAHTSSENIAEALKLLEEAAKLKKDELKSVITDKYAHLKNAIMETESGFVKSLSDAKRHAAEAASRAKEVGLQRARVVAGAVDTNVRQNPWSYIGGTAAVGLLLGYTLARNRK